MFIIDPIFAYFSPETLLPVGSILATFAGLAMMLGRGSLRFLLRCLKRVARPSSWVAGVSRPHFRFGGDAEPQTVRSDANSQSLESNRPQ
jgi:hypothetical protein